MLTTISYFLLNIPTISLAILPFILITLLPRAVNIFWTRYVFLLPFATLSIAILAIVKLIHEKGQFIYIYDLAPFFGYSFSANIALMFDTLSFLMIVVVAWVSAAVQFFACYYMQEDPYFNKFLSILILFTGCMLVFVTADNLLIALFGWEALGLCSFALIGFWTTRLQAIKAALKAIALNRIGDTALLCALALSAVYFNTWTFSDFNEQASLFFSISPLAVNTITFLIFLAAVAKSAQIGFHVWLSDAMEGPTPVSALLHAATMVTAGVFLIIRLAPFMLQSSSTQLACLIIGSLTAIFAAISAFFQYDLKKTIAFSTSSQIGFMFAACGVGAHHIAFFHLLTHAFFKALLFVCAGCAIHAFNGEQDTRKLGGLFSTHPILFAAMYLGSMALAGFPFLAGFYSKDLILAAVALHGFSGLLAFGTLFLASLLTAIYSANTIYLVFFGYRRSNLGDVLNQLVLSHISKEGYFSILLLLIPSVVIGFLAKQTYLDFWFSTGYFSVSDTLFFEISELLPIWFKLLTLTPGLLFVFVVEYQRLGRKFTLPLFFGQSLWQFFQNRAYFENIFYWFIVQPTLKLAFWGFYVWTERWVLENLIVTAPISVASVGSKLLVMANFYGRRGFLISFMVAFLLISDLFFVLNA